jgi:phage gpG-like protein
MTAFRIEVTDGPVIDALNQLAAQAADPTPAMRAIAGLLERQAEDNFAAESGPLGVAGTQESGECRKGGKISGHRTPGRVVDSWATADEAGVGAAPSMLPSKLGGQTKPYRNKRRHFAHVVKKGTIQDR